MKSKKKHFMGVGGAGCSAAFAIAEATGFQVSGCDKETNSPYLDRNLKKLVSAGHSSNHLGGVDTLVYSPAVTSLDVENEELSVARKKGLELLPWDQFVASYLLKDKFVIAIAGTHGKGTVAAMVGVILEKAGLDPTCLVGAIVVDWRRNYRVGKSKYFVVEADEYSEKFLNFSPKVGAITNIEFDHPEYFKDFDHLKETFKKFVDRLQVDSVLVVGPRVGFENKRGVTKKASEPLKANLQMLGEFNKINAAVAAAVAQELSSLMITRTTLRRSVRH
jgi:UDP-N-acetylmuramate--alanine ligase